MGNWKAFEQSNEMCKYQTSDDRAEQELYPCLAIQVRNDESEVVRELEQV
jgi:hypothetical protein